jgi:uncharacterized RDD family membrane protein YckC
MSRGDPVNPDVRRMNSQATKYAAFWKRSIALFIDLVIVYVLIGLVTAAVNATLGLPVEHDLAFHTGNAIKHNKFVEDNLIVLTVLYAFIKLGVLFPYFSIMESSNRQATLGKLVMRIKITDLRGERISLAKASVRFFAKILSTNILLIGYLIALFTERRQALHDLLASTVVINSNKMFP